MDNSWNAPLRRYYEKEVALSRRETKGYVETFMPNVMKILDYVNKKDQRFCKEPLRVGSYWRGLKVSKADEFDFDIPLAKIEICSWTGTGDREEKRYYGFNQSVIVNSQMNVYAKPPERHVQVIPDKLQTFPDDLEVVSTKLPLPPPPDGYQFFQRGETFPMWMNSSDLVRDGDIVPYLVRRKLKELLIKALRDLNLQGKNP